MRQNYKRLGDYIQLVNIRDVNIQVDKLLGVSIQKKFIPSIANIIGTDMSTYKIIKKSQFAYGPVTSRNGDKISIALLEEYDEAIVSQAYTVFEITDIVQLLPEYLMMWFRRPEFDRYARYKSHGSAREIFDWNEMCETLLPVPSPEKQRQLVNEYHVLVNRITINNRLIQKLEETAQAVYKEWFVDFEFPVTSHIEGHIEGATPSRTLNNKSPGYKSSGGEMVESEMGMIPKGWRSGKLSDIAICLDNKRRPLSELERNDFKGNYPYYGAMGIVDYVKDYIFDGEFLLFSEDGVNVIDDKGHPAVFLVWSKFWVNNHAHILQGKEGYPTRLLYLMLKNANVSDIVTGAAQPKINQDNMNNIKLVIPDLTVVELFKKNINPTFKHYINKIEQNKRLQILKDLLLSKLATIEN